MVRPSASSRSRTAPAWDRSIGVEHVRVVIVGMYEHQTGLDANVTIAMLASLPA
jgi:hypothetical protein